MGLLVPEIYNGQDTNLPEYKIKNNEANSQKKGWLLAETIPLFLSFVADLLCSNGSSFLLDTCFLASELAQIVKLGATHLTTLVHLDAVNIG